MEEKRTGIFGNLNEKTVATIKVGLGTTLWGASGLVVKGLFNLSSHINAVWISQVRMIVAGLILIVLAQLNRHEPMDVWKHKDTTLRMIAYGILGILPVQFAFYECVQLSNAAMATVIQFLGPFFILGYLAATKKQVLRPLDFISAIAGFGGVFLLATHGNIHDLRISPLALLFGLLSAVGVATSNTIPTPLVKKYSSMTVSGWGMLVSGIALMALPQNIAGIPFGDWRLWLGLAFVLILGTIVPFVWMNEALVHLSPAVVSLLDAFEPVASTIGSVLIFGLVLLPVDYIAIVLIIAATLAISMK